MSFELLTETPPLLKEGYLVHFSKFWDDKWADKYFKVGRVSQFEYDIFRIVSPGSSAKQDVSFDAPSNGGVSDQYLSLLPDNNKTMYEILVGFKGLPMIYPRYADKYFQYLEETGCTVNLDDTALRLQGFYDSRQSPWYAPKLREYTVKDQEPPHLYLFNPFQDDEKIVMHIVVNRCMLQAAGAEAAQGQGVKVAREVNHYSMYLW
jgi:hypothetical protein